MKTNLKLCLLLLGTLLSLPGFAQAQGTAITYQGRLNDAGTPASGLYDFTFLLFDSEADGVAVSGSVVLNAVLVTNGLFSVTLDFGPDIFTGPARWLEITVRTNGVGDPNILSPRTPLLPAPYSVFAGKAGSVASGSVTADHLNSGGVRPAAGQFLSYDGANFLWTDPGVVVGNTWLLNGANTYYNAGNVGIGTDSPASKLDVRGSLVLETGGSPALYTGTGNAELNRYLGLLNSPTLQSASGLKAGGVLVADSYSYANPGKNDLIVKSRIGVGTPTPTTRLTVKTVAGSVFDAYGIEHTDGTVRLTTYVDGVSGQLGTRSNHPLSFFVNDGLPIMTIDGNGVSMVSGSGFVTVGTPNGETGTSIKRGNNRADVRFDGSTLKLVAGPGFGPPSSFSGVAVTTAGNVGIGTTSPSRTLEVNGDFLARDASVRVLTIRGGADLAEPFAMSHSGVEPGSVVVIDEDHPGKLCRSTRAYDNKVAGIVSGANGIRPGISMVQEDKLEAGENVALSGRVYVNADASFGAIKPGDLLTSSDTPGHAMKVTEHTKAQGAILGKAMSGLREGKGMVLVLVTLQ